MPTRLSTARQRRILRLYFSGLPQTTIARMVGAGQGTVSNEVGRFKFQARSSSLEEASRLYEVEDLVEELRSLSIELRKLKVSAMECIEYAKALRRLQELGGDPSDIEGLLELSRRAKKEGFGEYISHAVRLAKLEAESGRDYRQLVKEFEEKAEQLKEMESRLAQLGKDVGELEGKKKKYDSELNKLKEQLEKKLKETGLTYQKIEQALKVRGLMEKLKISEGELGDFLEEIRSLGMDLKTATEILRESMR